MGCASGTKSGPVHLQLKSPAQTTYSAYKSWNVTHEYSGEQKVRDRQEGVEFLVASAPLTKSMKALNPPVGIKMTTVEKIGSMSLNDYGFPELKESIEFLN